MAWRAFTGLNGEWAWTDQVTGTWQEARKLLIAELTQFLADNAPPDGCGDCCQQGIEALAKLDATPEGEPFEAEVDGHDYLLLADDGLGAGGEHPRVR